MKPFNADTVAIICKVENVSVNYVLKILRDLIFKILWPGRVGRPIVFSKGVTLSPKSFIVARGLFPGGKVCMGGFEILIFMGVVWCQMIGINEIYIFSSWSYAPPQFVHP